MWFLSLYLFLFLILQMFPARTFSSYSPFFLSCLSKDSQLKLYHSHPSKEKKFLSFSPRNKSEEALSSFLHFKILLETQLHYSLAREESRVSLSRGFVNFKNTCYFNSILQILKHLLSYSEPLAQFPMAYDSIGSLVQKIFYNEFNELASPLTAALNSSTFSLKKILSKLNLDINHQEDSQEVFLNLLNGIDESIKGKKKSNHSESYEEKSLLPSFPFLIEVDEEFITFDQNAEEDLMQNTFKNLKLYSNTHDKQEILSLLTKKKSINYTQKKNYFFDLSLPVDDYKNSIENSMQKFFSSEYIENGDKPIVKNIFITKLPKILALHLKRFKYDPVLSDMKKISEPLEIPSSLSLAKYMENNSDSTSISYDLSAVLIHKGNIYNGHYFSYVKVPICTLFEEQGKTFSPASLYLLEKNNFSKLNMTELLTKVRYTTYVKPKLLNEENLTEENKYVWIRFNDSEVDIVTEEEVLGLAKGVIIGNTRNSSINSYMVFYSQKKND